MTETTKPTFQVMPQLSEEEYAALKEDIRENGVRVPVVKDADGITIDGHHRERAVFELRAEGHNVPDYPQEVHSDLTTEAEKRDLALKLNLQRRQLSRAQKQQIVANVLKATPERSNREIARLTGVSDKTVGTYRGWLEQTAEITQLEKTVGRDGKERAAHVDTTSVPAELRPVTVQVIREDAVPVTVKLNRTEEPPRKRETILGPAPGPDFDWLSTPLEEFGEQIEFGEDGRSTGNDLLPHGEGIAQKLLANLLDNIADAYWDVAPEASEAARRFQEKSQVEVIRNGHRGYEDLDSLTLADLPAVLSTLRVLEDERED